MDLAVFIVDLRELPEAARRYILYHTIACPLIFTWFMLPYYLLVTGLTVLEVGLLFTAVNLAAIGVTAVIGRFFTERDVRRGLVLIDLLGGISSILYGFASGPLASLIVFAGMLIEKISLPLYPLYQAYERSVYPRDRLKEALIWHLRLPELAIVVTYPIFGYLLGVLCPHPYCIRAAFLAFGIVSILLVPIQLAILPSVVPSKAEEEVVEEPRWLRLYVLAELVFTLAWSLAPTLSLVYYVVEVYEGGLLHIALIEVSISSATILATFIAERIERGEGHRVLQAGTLLTTLGIVGVVAAPSFPLLLLAFHIVRLGDALVFIFKRMWLYELVPARKAALVPSYIAALREALSLASPMIASSLSMIDPRAPYTASLTLFILLLIIYRRSREYFRES